MGLKRLDNSAVGHGKVEEGESEREGGRDGAREREMKDLERWIAAPRLCVCVGKSRLARA